MRYSILGGALIGVVVMMLAPQSWPLIARVGAALGMTAGITGICLGLITASTR